MPGQDRTGPMSQGPMTGRGLGFCGQAQGFRRGFGRGLGRGFGFRNQVVELNEEQEKKILEAELAGLEVEKSEINKRLESFK